MAKMQTTNHTGIPLFFNLQSAVGRGCPNISEDVQLLSFLMKCAAASPSSGPKTRAALAQVQVTASMTPALQKSIDDYQTAGGGKSDGRVSVATGPSGHYGGGGNAAFIICQLNYATRKAFPNDFPRLDRISGCPPIVAALVQRTIVGS